MRFGIVGAGVIGQLRAQSIKEHPSTDLVAVLDPSAAAAAKAVAGTSARAVSTLDEFLKIEMDAVIVSSPPHLHEESCLGALERGRHVLCEKPLSNTLDASRRILDAAEEAGLALAVGSFFLHTWNDFAVAWTFWPLAGAMLGLAVARAREREAPSLPAQPS